MAVSLVVEHMIEHFGYERGEDFKLYCTVSTLRRNSQGLILRIDNNKGWLLENSDLNEIGDFAVWTLEVLHNRLLEKHNETFWIGAESRTINGTEHFIYSKAEHTQKPIVSQFGILIEQGIITMDHLIKKQSNGKVVEKGPLFKFDQQLLVYCFHQVHNTIYYPKELLKNQPLQF